MRHLHGSAMALAIAAIGLASVNAAAQTPEGNNSIRNRNSGLCLEVEDASTEPGAQIIQNRCTRREDQLFRLAVDGRNPDLYYIIVDHTGQCIGPRRSESTNPRAPIVQARCTTQDHHKFRLVSMGSYYRIVSERSGLCLAVEGSSLEAGARIVQFGCSGRPNQQFLFVP